MADKLTAQQEAAVTNRGGKLLVSAAAGSGKTKVLVDRLLSYLTDPVAPANLDDFLIITYTKAAASELRGKIAAKLTDVMAQDPANRHLQRQMQRLYLTKISTVHSFCTDVLREYAYRLDIPGDFRVADENECTELKKRAIDLVLNEAYENAADDPEFRAFIDSQGFGRDDRQVLDIVLKVYDSACCHLSPEEWLDRCIQNCKADASAVIESTVWCQHLIEDLYSFLEWHIDALENCVTAASAADGFAKPVALLQDTILQLRKLRESKTWDDIRRNFSIDFGRLTFDKAAKSTPLAEQIKAIRNACKTGLEKKSRRFADSAEQTLADMDRSSVAVRGLVKLVRQFSVKYSKMKKTRRMLDFSDLEHKMLDLLYGKDRLNPTSAALELAQNFREVMVDEYQDSNAVQDAIFDALTAQRQNCFMVGDVKQSIYQFRLADPGIFLHKYSTYLPAEEALPGQGRKLLLTSNFRSSGAVIDAVNAVFGQCMSHCVGGLEYGADEMLYEGIPHEPLSDPQIELHCISVTEDTYREEADLTADRIQELLNSKQLVRDKDGLRPVRPEDIVILLRSPGSVGSHFQFALESRGIHCATGGNVDLMQTEEISVLRSLLQVISNPLQDIPLIGVITSRIFGFTADELARIRSIDKKSSIFHALMMDDSQKTRSFLHTLELLRNEARMGDLSDLLEKILTHTHLDSIFGALPDGEMRKNNLQAFYRIISEYENAGYRSLVHFLAHLDAVEEKGISVSSENTNAGCVTIMSIHKSKGLEFPVVFLCGLSREFNRESVNAPVLCDKELGLGLLCVDSKNRIRYPSIAKRAIASKMLSDSLSEELRVLYVAMTRAKDRLIMTYASKYLESEVNELLHRMPTTAMGLLTAEASCPGHWILLTALTRTEAGALFALSNAEHTAKVSDYSWKITVSEESGQKCISEAAEEEQRDSLDPTTVEKLKEALSFSYGHLKATTIPSKHTATQLKGRAKDQEVAEGTHAASSRHHWRKPSFIEENIEGTFYGKAIHAAMQYIRFAECSCLEATQKEIERIAAEGYLSAEQARLADAKRINNFFASELGRRIRNGNVLREFKFSILEDADEYFPDMKDEKILLQGVIDCALVEDDGITIVDFKTDKVTEETVASVTQKYSPQVQTYAKALEKIYQLPVKAKYLYYFHTGEFVAVE